MLFDRDARGDGIPVKKRRFLSEISVTLATPCRDNLPSNYPDFWKNANNHTILEGSAALVNQTFVFPQFGNYGINANEVFSENML